MGVGAVCKGREQKAKQHQQRQRQGNKPFHDLSGLLLGHLYIDFITDK
jgi:hypothetical protein